MEKNAIFIFCIQRIPSSKFAVYLHFDISFIKLWAASIQESSTLSTSEWTLDRFMFKMYTLAMNHALLTIEGYIFITLYDSSLIL